MLYLYLVVSAALIPILDRLGVDILRESYSWWLVPLLLICLFVGFVLIHILVFVVSVQFVNLNKTTDKFYGYFRFNIKTIIPILLKLARVDIRLSGEDKVDSDRKMLYICNHQHDFDPIMMLKALPDSDLAFIGKKEIYTQKPFIAKIMHKLRSLPIDRENDREAAKTIIAASRILKEGKSSIGLFPEGYCSKDGELLPIRNGSLKIAYKAEAPIVVCVINNTRALPKRIFRRHTDIEFRVLSVIEYEQYKHMTTTELGNLIHDQMNEALNQIKSGA